MLELRVLTGTHAGARALLTDEAQWIGSGDNCALILTDEGLLEQHARIEHRPDGTLLLSGAGADDPPIVLRPGESVWVGPVRIAVEILGAPWREDLPMAAARVASEPAPEAPLPAPPPPPEQAPSGRRRGWWTLAGITVCTSVAALGWPLAHSVLAPEPATAPPQQTPVAISKEPLGQLITRLGMKGRVTYDTSDAQHPKVRAQFLSGEEAETLANELSSRRPVPRLDLVDEAQAVEQVLQGVERLGELANVRLGARYLGRGRFRVEGLVAEAAQRDQITADLRDTYPQVTEFELAIDVRSEVARAFVDELKRQGGTPVQARWERGLITMEVRLPPGGVSQWEQALLLAASRHPVPFRAEVKGLEAAPTVSEGGQLPFRVRSVVTQPLPYVVLADGRKLSTGGEIEGWRLLGIDARTVRFQGPQGHSMTLER